MHYIPDRVREDAAAARRRLEQTRRSATIQWRDRLREEDRAVARLLRPLPRSQRAAVRLDTEERRAVGATSDSRLV